MDISLIPIWITSGFSALGVVYAILRNGRRGRAQDEQLKTELKMEVASINKVLENPNTGLGAIKTSVDDQRLHCAQVSTRIEAKTDTNSHEIEKLRKQRKL